MVVSDLLTVGGILVVVVVLDVTVLLEVLVDVVVEVLVDTVVVEVLAAVEDVVGQAVHPQTPIKLGKTPQ